ncbi:MAG: DUF167 domain-containing protein [Nitrospirae bacterium]|jgi:uncharacterized protein|nr:DUF167 domain-containing protein [Nitrospirota bacterium]
MEIPFRKSKRGITIKVRVEPRSSKRNFSGLIGDTLKVKVHSPPSGGAANEELIEVLAEKIGVKRTAIKIIKGHTSKNKLIEIEGIDSVP